MPMPDGRYTFERWTLDCRRGALTGEGGEIALRPKAFEVLRFLVENAGRLVSRDEILDTVWPNVTVTEESLTHCVSEIRQAFGDADQRIIKTVPRRGYLFAVSVSGEDAAALQAGTAPSPEPIASAAAPDASTAPPAQPSLREPSIAVLPFANLSGDPAQEYLSDGFTEDIINGLSYFSELSVIARNSAFVYKGRAVDVRAVGRELGVSYLVEGSVRRFADQLRVTVQLVDTRSGIRRWAERFDRTVEDIFAVQDEIAQAIVRIAVAHLGHAERERVQQSPPTSWTAYDLSLRADAAQRAYTASWALDKLNETRRLYAEARKADPDNASICAKLAFVTISAYHNQSDPECGNATVLKHGYALAEEAVRLNPNMPVARASLGWALMWMREHDAAITEYEKAFALNPSFSHPYFGLALVNARLSSRALSFLHEHARLDPFHPPPVYGIQGRALYDLKRFSEAMAPLSECRRRSPGFLPGSVWLVATLARLGQVEEAKALAADILARWPRAASHWLPAVPFSTTEHAEHTHEALREAGFL